MSALELERIDAGLVDLFPPVRRAFEARPIAFGPLRGTLHAPVDGDLGVGLVLVSALGRDGRCGHMPMRVFADRLASAGVSVLRYDHRGAGDSLDLADADGDAVTQWLDGLDDAIDELRARSGARRLILGGVRIGGTLAALKAERADGLLLLAPVVSGRSYLNRMRFAAHLGAGRGEDAGDQRPLDTDGLWLSSASCRSLAQVDLMKRPPPACPTFFAAQNKVTARFGAWLAAASADVRQVDFPEYNDLFLDAAVNLPPLRLFAAAQDWLCSFASAPPPRGSRRAQRTRADEVLRPPGAVERPVGFGEALRGILCEPDPPKPRSEAVLFLNTGGDPRAGSGGFAAMAARRLAARGVASLRFDFSGLGDSPMPNGGDVRCHVFETPREREIDAAMELLVAAGHRAVTVVGVCSGAYHALRTAWRRPDATGVFAVSPSTIVWTPEDQVTFDRDEYMFSLADYARALLRPSAWKAAISSGVSFVGLLRALWRRLTKRISSAFDRRSADSPLAQARRFAQRGGRAMLLMGVNDMSLEEMANHFGPGARGLRGLRNVSIEVVPGLDHGLVIRNSRELAARALISWLGLDDDAARD